ncbi:hypothetical protein AB1Y20_014808 [Prymnesium parvum]|uniref:Cyclin N-terminal domain-containing protein n=1 Tax=Prymnesium parvum TaxID=97485 RepID=A0AB34ICI0_PRYPA
MRRIKSAETAAMPRGATKGLPLQPALQAAGLQQYWRKLREMGYQTVAQLLRLRRGKALDELLDLLRPLPGHRIRLLNFVEEERARAQLRRAPHQQPPQLLGRAMDFAAPLPTNSAPHHPTPHHPTPTPTPHHPTPTPHHPTPTPHLPTPTPLLPTPTTNYSNSKPAARGTARQSTEGSRAAAGRVRSAAAAAREARLLPTDREAKASDRQGKASDRQGKASRPSSGAARLFANDREVTACRPARGVRPASAREASRDPPRPQALSAREERAVAAALHDLEEQQRAEAVEEGAEEDEEAMAIAFLRQSWAREMLGRKAGDAIDAVQEGAEGTGVADEERSVSPREADVGQSEGAGRCEEARREEVARWEGERSVEEQRSEEDERSEEEDQLDEDARSEEDALSEEYVRSEEDARGEEGWKENALPSECAGSDAEEEAALLAAVQRELRAARRAPLDEPPVLSPRGEASPRAAKPPRRRSLLANSLDTHARPSGVVSRPDRREVYSSVSFVLHKHIELHGRFLLLRSEAFGAPRGERREDSPPPQVPPQRMPPPPASPPPARTSPPEEAEEILSPDAPASVRHALLSGVNSVYGLRYSIDLSPVREATAEAAAPPLDLAASVCWEGGWAPPSDGDIFDSRLHPLRPPNEPPQPRDPKAPLPRLRVPLVSDVSNLIRGVATAAQMGPEASLVGLAYIERLVSFGNVQLNANTWQRISLTALLLAHKMWDDDCLENAQFAEVCSIDVQDLNKLEQVFVAAVGYNLSLSAAEYARYYFALRSICQMSSERFPLRCLDEELEERLAERALSVASSYGAALEPSRAQLRDWDDDLRRSI